jgi:hypothetical protein
MQLRIIFSVIFLHMLFNYFYRTFLCLTMSPTFVTFSLTTLQTAVCLITLSTYPLSFLFFNVLLSLTHLLYLPVV